MCKVLLEAAEFPDETWAPVVHARFLDDRAQAGALASPLVLGPGSSWRGWTRVPWRRELRPTWRRWYAGRAPHRACAPRRHRQSETMCTCTASSQVTQGKARYASKPPQASSLFFVELVRGSAGFGLTFSGCRGVAGDATLTVHRLLKDGPAQRCGRLQAGDLVLHINGESTQGLTHAQVVEQIRTGGPRLHLMLSRPLETHPGKPKEVGEPRKRDVLPPSDCSPDPGGPEIMKSRSASAYPLQHLRSRGSPEPHPEGAAEGPVVPSPERLTEGPDNGTLGSPGPWLVPSEERLSRALGVPGTAHLALEMATGRRRH
ncbi:PDZ domain-containing protein MAGIX isoform X5 [Manis pentadactyla]|uniref:PDZ domain-containing protein MAGIX isoform X5 n=1 Tax=Manis pentadactyla TaxID=143292 RepID=UPI00255CEF5E|nr:PDZ domain-containing protein MAGIX isoform X5 [Manis pentadactyla]